MTHKIGSNDILHYLIEQGKSDIILNSLPVGVEIFDKDGTLLYISKPAARMLGIDQEAIMARRLSILDDPNLPVEFKNGILEKREFIIRTSYDLEKAYQTYNYKSTTERKTIELECIGNPIVGENGETDNYIIIIQDITEEIRKEEQLNNSRLKTELAIRDSEIMLWEFDRLRREFYSDNEPLNAYDRSKAISIETYTSSVHPEDRIPAIEIIEQMLTGKNFNFSIEARILFPENPEWQYCTISGVPFERDSKGVVVKYVGTRKNNTSLQKRKLLQDKILNSIPLPIHIKDVDDDFRYVFCNEESKRMFGTSEDKTTYDVMDAEQVARIEKTDKEVFATGTPYLGLERITLKDGRSYDTIVRKSIIHDDGRRLLLNVRWDQSLQNDLERRSKLLSISMEAMNAYSWFFEPDEGHISFGEGFDRPGRAVSKLNSLENFILAIHPDDRELFASTLDATICEQTDEWIAEYRVDLNASGVYEWWKSRGLLETTLRDEVPYRYMYGMSINIDTHKQTELTLRRNKEELDMLVKQNNLVLNNTNSGLAYITTDYIVQWENISLCTKSLSFEAYKKGEFCYQSAHGRTSPCEECVLQRAMKSRQLEQIQFLLNNQNIVEVFATPVIKNNEVEGIVIRVDDVTERERIMEELRHAKAQAEQSDKLKSAFLANMSHEIRTPLNAIVGFSELLAAAPDSEDREEYTRIISSNNELLLKLINDILDLSKIEAGSVELKYEDFDLAEYFNSMATSMQQRITNHNVRLITNNPHEVCHVQLDKNRIAQILTNYVTNAIKYTPKGFIEMGYESRPDGIRFYVRDTGIGITEEKKGKVFHRFEKLDEFAQGTGLGLSICKAITESMGGEVGFESQAGEGSLFWAFLPCEPKVALSANSQDDSPQQAGGGNPIQQPSAPATLSQPMCGLSKPKILVAEDIHSNYLLVSSLLKNKYELLHAKNGREAVEMVTSMHPDLVLMDMKMPVMDGMTATVEIRKFAPDLPIIALTAHAFDTDRQAALAVGCTDYMVKPVNKKQLLELLGSYCFRGE